MYFYPSKLKKLRPQGSPVFQSLRVIVLRARNCSGLIQSAIQRGACPCCSQPREIQRFLVRRSDSGTRSAWPPAGPF